MMLKIKKKFLPPFGDVYIGPLNRKWYFIQLPQIQILEHRSQRIQRPHTLNTDPQNFTLKGPQRFQRLHILNINNQIPHSTLGGLTLSSSGTSHPEPRCQKPKQNQKVWKQTWETNPQKGQTPPSLKRDPKHLRLQPWNTYHESILCHYNLDTIISEYW